MVASEPYILYNWQKHRFPRATESNINYVDLLWHVLQHVHMYNVAVTFHKISLC